MARASEVTPATRSTDQSKKSGSTPTLTLSSSAVVVNPLFQPGKSISVPISALQLRVVKIGMRLACDLNRQWHSLLPRADLGNMLCGNMSVAYGAEHDDRWYAVAIWSQPIIRANCDGKTIELRRMAICADAPKYTASRILGVMRRLIKKEMPYLTRAISYQAIEVHEGTIYKASGWQRAGKISAARPQRFSNVSKRTRATGPLQTHSPKQRWEIAL